MTDPMTDSIEVAIAEMARLATDQSGRFVELIRERGIPAQLMDVTVFTAR